MITNYQIPEKIKNQLIELSESSEEEICGYICEEVFFKKKNVHPEPRNHFLIHPLDCVWDKKAILFHSHPDHIKRKGFSEWDLENQTYFEMDMLLYSVNNKEFYFKNYD